MKGFIEVQSAQGPNVIIRIDAIVAISFLAGEKSRIWVQGIAVAIDVNLSNNSLMALMEKEQGK